MAENERMMKEMEQKWEEKLAAAEKENKEKDDKERTVTSEKKSKPHLYNLNPDPILTGMVVHLLDQDVTTLGKQDNELLPTIPLHGLNIHPKHGEISVREDGKFVLKAGVDCRIFVNGEPLNGEIELRHNDRLMFGTSHLYVFSNPKQATKENEIEISYEMAQKEIAQNSGMNVKNKSTAPVSKEEIEEQLLREELTDFLPEVNEANGISEELDKKVQFDVVLLTPAARGKVSGKKEIFIKVLQLETGYVWFWRKQKFINRKYVMQEMYEDFQNGEKWQVPPERDPFIESHEEECLIGTAEVYLLSLAYQMEYIGEIPIVDYRGVCVGNLKLKIIPCKEDGSALSDVCIDDPEQLKGKRIDFKVMLDELNGLPKRYVDIFCQFSLLTYENERTNVYHSSSVDVTLNFEKQLTIDGFSDRIADSLTKYPLIVQVIGKQKPGRKKPVNNAAKLGQNTREIMKAEALKKSLGGKVSKKPKLDLQTLRNTAENVMMKKRMALLQKKMEKLRKYCKEEEKKGESKVEICLVFDIIGRESYKKIRKKLKKLKRLNSGSSKSSISSCSSFSSESDGEVFTGEVMKSKGKEKMKKVKKDSCEKADNRRSGSSPKKDVPKEEKSEVKKEEDKKKSSACVLF